MVSLDDAVVARLARFGTTFEILVDPEGVEKLLGKKDASDADIEAVLAIDEVFTHWTDGKRASDEQLEQGFETLDVTAIARRILREGEVQLTQEQRKAMLERKHRRLVDHIARNAWNPQTKNPHPRDRIERALVEGKWHTDPLRPVEEQVQAALKVLRPLIPIAFERIQIAALIPAQYTGKAYGHVRQLGDVRKEEWQQDGSLVVVLEIPAGAQTEVYDALNAATHGEVQTRIIDSQK
jgi:ribosome maturation protein SDO1